MGLPIFREPVAERSNAAAKVDPTAHRRSTIRRERTIRSPRRQEEVHFISSSGLPSHRSDDRHHGSRVSSSRYSSINRPSRARDHPSRLPPAHPQHPPSLAAVNGAGNMSIHLSDSAWREAVGRMSAPEQPWHTLTASSDNAAPAPTVSSSRPLISGLMSHNNNAEDVARPRSRRGPPEDITRETMSLGAMRRRMERDRQASEELHEAEGRERRYNDILNGVPVPPLQTSHSDRAYRREIESLPRLRRMSVRPQNLDRATRRLHSRARQSSRDAQRPSRMPAWATDFDEADDDHWEHMLSTITPDPHLPSHDSSFTSAAATGGSGAADATGADSLATPITAPSIGDDELAQDDCEDGHDNDHAFRHEDSDSASHAESLDNHYDSLIPPLAPNPPEAPSFEQLFSHPPMLTSSTPSSNGHAIIRITASPVRRVRTRSASPFSRPRSASPSTATTAPTRLHDSSRHYRLPSPPVNSFGYMVQASLRPDHHSSRSGSHGGGGRDSPHAADRHLRASSHLSEVIIPGTTEHETRLDEMMRRRSRDIAAAAAAAAARQTTASPSQQSLGTLRSSLTYHAQQYERRHQPDVHDEDTAAERERMREVLESLVRRRDLGDEWWGSVGLERRTLS